MSENFSTSCCRFKKAKRDRDVVAVFCLAVHQSKVVSCLDLKGDVVTVTPADHRLTAGVAPSINTAAKTERLPVDVRQYVSINGT